MSCPISGFVLPYTEIDHRLIEAVGAKNANLAELATHLQIKIPNGFAITTAAYYEFIRFNNLSEKITAELNNWQQGRISLEQASANIQKLILAGRLPARLAQNIDQAVERLVGHKKNKNFFFAVRSSAWGEDGDRSFAGQYSSKLNVRVDDLKNQYRHVLAGLYGEKALSYRQSIGFEESEVAMSVACQEMIDGQVSGVLYTLHPTHPEHNTMLLSASWGLGAPVMSGHISADRFTIERLGKHKIIEMNLVHKLKALRMEAGGDTSIMKVETDNQDKACLHTGQVQKLAETGIIIERYFKCPQDIEFTFDPKGELVILQARRLTIQPTNPAKPEALSRLKEKYSVLLQGVGEVAQRGIGAGPVFLLKTDQDLKNFPSGAILVAQYASPLLAQIMPRAAGIITDVGSTTGHLATVAREFRVPCLFNTGNATQKLQSEQEITLDTEENIVYQGLIKELQAYSLVGEDINETQEYRLLRRILRKVEPLNLLDPAENNFIPEACQTLHDITRFIHEKAVDALIDLNYGYHHGHKSMAGKLDWQIPLDLIMIDVGGGLKTTSQDKIKISDVLSVPLKVLLAGIAHPKAWDNTPMSVDMGSFMSSLTRTFSPELASPKQIGQNLAVVSSSYANISLHLGYHFTMIDSYLTDDINNNYAYFRFFGGVTDSRRRGRRAKFLGKVLANHDFRIELHDDLVVARIKKLDKQSMMKRLYLLGLLIGFTRQLDVKMVSEQSINDYNQKLELLLEAAND
jgi:pyruvate,water dikinase